MRPFLVGMPAGLLRVFDCCDLRVSVLVAVVAGVGATLALVCLGLLSTGVATVVYYRVVARAGATFLSLINYLIPVYAVLAGAVFLGERLLPHSAGVDLDDPETTARIEIYQGDVYYLHETVPCHGGLPLAGRGLLARAVARLWQQGVENAVFGGILGRRALPSDLAEMEEHRIEAIDLVVVNFYPFAETVARPGVAEPEVIESIDIDSISTSSFLNSGYFSATAEISVAQTKVKSPG